MDNFQFDMTSEGDLTEAMKLVFAHTRNRAAGYRITPEKGLAFYWTTNECPLVERFPFWMDAVGAADFAKRWLAEVEYGPEPDHDGDNGKGWRLYCEAWGMIGYDRCAFIAVQPAWAQYGK